MRCGHSQLCRAPSSPSAAAGSGLASGLADVTPDPDPLPPTAWRLECTPSPRLPVYERCVVNAASLAPFELPNAPIAAKLCRYSGGLLNSTLRHAFRCKRLGSSSTRRMSAGRRGRVNATPQRWVSTADHSSWSDVPGNLTLTAQVPVGAIPGIGIGGQPNQKIMPARSTYCRENWPLVPASRTAPDFAIRNP